MQPLKHQQSNQPNPEKDMINSASAPQKPKLPQTASKNENTNNIEPEWWTKPKKKVVSLSNLLRALNEVNIEAFLPPDSDSNKPTKDTIRYPSTSKNKLKKVQNLNNADNERSPSIKIFSTHQVSLSYPDSNKNGQQQISLDPAETLEKGLMPINNDKITNQCLLANPNHEWSRLQWKNLSKLFPGSNLINPHEIAPNDITQGKSRDSYLLSGLAAFAQKPHIIPKFIQKSTENPTQYQVKLLKGGQWNTINIDDSVPVDDNLPAFSYSKNGSYWVPLIEKAWAKLHGSYENIQKGIPEQILHNLTGAPIKHFFLHSQFFQRQKFWRYLNYAHQKNFIMIATANFGSEVFLPENLTLDENETYTILGTDIEDLYGHSERLIKLRNNWKNFKNGNAQENSEMFVMRFSEFIKKFRLVVVAEVLGEGEYKSLSVRSEQYEGAFFKIEVDEEGDFTFVVNRNLPKQARTSNKPVRYPEIMIELGRIDYKRVARLDGLISRKRTATKSYKLSPGYYIAHVKIFPSKQFPIKQDQQITLGVYSQKKYHLKKANQIQAMMLSQNQQVLIKSINEKLAEKQNIQIVLEMTEKQKNKKKGTVGKVIVRNGGEEHEFIQRTPKQMNIERDAKEKNQRNMQVRPNDQVIELINEQIKKKDLGEEKYEKKEDKNEVELKNDEIYQSEAQGTEQRKDNIELGVKNQVNVEVQKQSQQQKIISETNKIQTQQILNAKKNQVEELQESISEATKQEIKKIIEKDESLKETKVQEQGQVAQYQQNLHHQFELFQKHLFTFHIPTEIAIPPLLFIQPIQQEDKVLTHSYEYHVIQDANDVARNLFPPSQTPRSSRLYVHDNLSRSTSRQLLPIHSQQISMQGDFEKQFKRYSELISDNQQQPIKQLENKESSEDRLVEEVSPENKEFHTKVNYLVMKNQIKDDQGNKKEQIALIVDKIEYPNQEMEEQLEREEFIGGKYAINNEQQLIVHTIFKDDENIGQEKHKIENIDKEAVEGERVRNKDEWTQEKEAQQIDNKDPQKVHQSIEEDS